MKGAEMKNKYKERANRIHFYFDKVHNRSSRVLHVMNSLYSISVIFHKSYRSFVSLFIFLCSKSHTRHHRYFIAANQMHHLYL
uniref:Uncharacterized protein n=1 Tax=Solanum tuberosum TaxID=4113 RepID=M0ZPX0_SOLTU